MKINIPHTGEHGGFEQVAIHPYNPNYPDENKDVYPYFQNYESAFHDEIWSSTFIGGFSTGLSWFWENIFWWEDANEVPWTESHPGLTFLNDLTYRSNSYGFPNKIPLTLPPVVNLLSLSNRKLYDEFEPLAQFIANNTQMLNKSFTSHYGVYPSTAAPLVETFYLVDNNQKMALGWVHFTPAYWANKYYYNFENKGLGKCEMLYPSNANSAFRLENIDLSNGYDITFSATRSNLTVPNDISGLTSISNQYLDVPIEVSCDAAQSDYAFVARQVGYSQRQSSHSADHKNIGPQNMLFTCYPNPTSSDIHIKVNKDVLQGDLVDKSLKIEITSIDGTQLFSDTRALVYDIVINCDSFRAGLYLLKLITEQGTNSYKIVKL